MYSKSYIPKRPKYIIIWKGGVIIIRRIRAGALILSAATLLLQYQYHSGTQCYDCAQRALATDFVRAATVVEEARIRHHARFTRTAQCATQFSCVASQPFPAPVAYVEHTVACQPLNPLN